MTILNVLSVQSTLWVTGQLNAATRVQKAWIDVRHDNDFLGTLQVQENHIQVAAGPPSRRLSIECDSQGPRLEMEIQKLVMMGSCRISFRRSDATAADRIMHNTEFTMDVWRVFSGINFVCSFDGHAPPNLQELANRDWSVVVDGDTLATVTINSLRADFDRIVVWNPGTGKLPQELCSAVANGKRCRLVECNR